MPHLDGIGVLEKLNNSNNMPICIMLSAVGQDNITKRALMMGASYYMVKPFELDVLVKRIRDLKNITRFPGNNFVVKENNLKTNYINIANTKYKTKYNIILLSNAFLFFKDTNTYNAPRSIEESIIIV